MEGIGDHRILVFVSFSVFVKCYYQRLFNVICMKYNAIGKMLRFKNYLRKKKRKFSGSIAFMGHAVMANCLVGWLKCWQRVISVCGYSEHTYALDFIHCVNVNEFSHFMLSYCKHTLHDDIRHSISIVCCANHVIRILSLPDCLYKS